MWDYFHENIVYFNGFAKFRHHVIWSPKEEADIHLFNVTPGVHILDLQITKNFVLLLLKAPRPLATRLHLRLLDQRRSS